MVLGVLVEGSSLEVVDVNEVDLLRPCYCFS